MLHAIYEQNQTHIYNAGGVTWTKLDHQDKANKTLEEYPSKPPFKDEVG